MKLIGKHKLFAHQQCYLAKQPAWDIVKTDLNGMSFVIFLDFKRSMINPADIAMFLIRQSEKSNGEDNEASW